jgi:hypothetical protein
MLVITMPSTAIANKLAVRLMALLMPEAVPVLSWLTEPSTVVVKGATVMLIPTLIVNTAGKKVSQ